ncbi:FtsX-like permease family protein [Actinomadura sp. WAC 06369]|uniref:FtsX-like permease family protein n=1 Tax=Actinomadura sp. WAC 06369 TaxID=2203193 RepID=UPI00131558FD|nr:FtsX-like permease family protein [Actinomadura sp. WAC 06369]
MARPPNGPWSRLARAQWAPLAALGVLTLVTALLAVAVPASTAAGYDRAARAAVGRTPAVVVEGKVQAGEARTAVPTNAAMMHHGRAWEALLPPALHGAAGQPEPSVTTDRMSVAGDRGPQLLAVGWDAGALERVRFVEGAAPRNGPNDRDGAALHVAMARPFAERLGHRVGDELVLPDKDAGPLRVRVSGLYEPEDPGDPYWAERGFLLRPETVTIGSDGTRADAGTLLADGPGYRLLTAEPARRLTYTWRFPVRADAVDAAGAAGLAAALEAYRTAVKSRVEIFPCAVESSLGDDLAGYAGRLHAARSVLGLAFGGLAAVAAGAVLLAAGLLGDRLRPALAAMRARGASLPQLAAPACAVTAAAVLPAAALGYAAGRLLDAGPPQDASAVAVAVLAALAVAVPAAAVLRERVPTAAGGRADLAAVRPSRRRLVLDGLLVALAAIGVVLLRRRGADAGAAAGADPLVAAVPVLLGAALGALVLRCYPYLLRAAGPLLRRRSGAVAFLGVARAARQGAIGALPLAVLLLAAATAGFTATVDAGLQRAQDRAAWSRVGADARVSADRFRSDAAERLRGVDGVTGVVPARIVPDVTTPDDPAPITLIAVDLDAYRDLAPAVPGVPAAPGTSRALLSPAAADIAGPGPVTLGRYGLDPVRVTAAGRIERFPGQTAGSAFAIVPFDAVTAGGAAADYFVAGTGLDAAALRAAADGTGVELRRDVLHAMTDAPLVTVVHRTFAGGALIAAAFGLLTVLLVLVVGARARAETVARLRVLGLSRRQGRALALVELAPVLLCAVGAGWALGLLLPGITGPVVDLRPYTSGFAATAGLPSAAAVLGLLAALLAAAAAAVLVDRAFDARTGAVPRTGDRPT